MQRQALRHGAPEEVLQALRRLATTAKRLGADAAAATVQERLSYLATRRGMLDYAWYHARGYPIGSGSVENANKPVVERRLKGAGMHSAWVHVHAMVALRAIACNDRWQEAWPRIAQRVRRQAGQGQRERQLARRQSKAWAPLTSLPPHPPVVLPSMPAEEPMPAPRRFPPPRPAARKGSQRPYRPPPDHPWRRCRMRLKSPQLTKMIAGATL